MSSEEVACVVFFAFLMGAGVSFGLAQLQLQPPPQNWALRFHGYSIASAPTDPGLVLRSEFLVRRICYTPPRAPPPGLAKIIFLKSIH